MATSDDAKITYYVAGALIRPVLKQNKGCSDCKTLLLDMDNPSSEMDLPASSDGLEISDCFKQFVLEIDRGGLLKPSSLALAVCLKCWEVFNVITQNAQLKTDFLTSNCSQRDLFLAILLPLLQADCDIVEMCSEQLCCFSSHQSIKDLVCRFFNTMASNLVRKMAAEAQKIVHRSERKAKKLTSVS